MSLTGAVCASGLDGMAEALERLCDEADQCVTLDLEKVDFIDVSALQMLVGAAAAFRQKRKRLRLKNAISSVFNNLDRLHLLDIFCHEQDCDHNCDQGGSVRSDSDLQVEVFTLPMNLSFARDARQRIDRIAERLGYCKADRNDIALAVGEAATNAIKHGAETDGEDQFTVSCVANSDKLCLSVSDNGLGFALDALPPCDDYLMVDHGRGIFFMKSVMDSVSFQFDSGTTVQMVKTSSRKD